MDHYGLIGNPVSHSLSEKYFTDKFVLKDIDARYERFLLKDIHGLPILLETYPHLKGLSVTSPFKTDVIQYCDELDEITRQIKAVNTLKISIRGGKTHIKGYNTDIDGFAAAILRMIGNKKPYTLVLGSGGAARAVTYALNKLGIRYTVVSRHTGPGKIVYNDLTGKIIAEHKLIVNTTPLGMGRHPEAFPDIPYQHISSDHLIYDLIYNPAETPFLRKAKQKGARTENGLVMLQAQAEKAWEIWNI